MKSSFFVMCLFFVSTLLGQGFVQGVASCESPDNDLVSNVPPLVENRSSQNLAGNWRVESLAGSIVENYVRHQAAALVVPYLGKVDNMVQNVQLDIASNKMFSYLGQAAVLYVILYSTSMLMHIPYQFVINHVNVPLGLISSRYTIPITPMSSGICIKLMGQSLLSVFFLNNVFQTIWPKKRKFITKELGYDLLTHFFPISEEMLTSISENKFCDDPFIRQLYPPCLDDIKDKEASDLNNVRRKTGELNLRRSQVRLDRGIPLEKEEADNLNKLVRFPLYRREKGQIRLKTENFSWFNMLKTLFYDPSFNEDVQYDGVIYNVDQLIEHVGRIDKDFVKQLRNYFYNISVEEQMAFSTLYNVNKNDQNELYAALKESINRPGANCVDKILEIIEAANFYSQNQTEIDTCFDRFLQLGSFGLSSVLNNSDLTRGEMCKFARKYEAKLREIGFFEQIPEAQMVELIEKEKETISNDIQQLLRKYLEKEVYRQIIEQNKDNFAYIKKEKCVDGEEYEDVCLGNASSAMPATEDSNKAIFAVEDCLDSALLNIGFRQEDERRRYIHAFCESLQAYDDLKNGEFIFTNRLNILSHVCSNNASELHDVEDNDSNWAYKELQAGEKFLLSFYQAHKKGVLFRDSKMPANSDIQIVECESSDLLTNVGIMWQNIQVYKVLWYAKRAFGENTPALRRECIHWYRHEKFPYHLFDDFLDALRLTFVGKNDTHS